MDSSTPSLDFAVIGHQDSWDHIRTFVNRLRNKEHGELSMQNVKSIFPFIPPRDLFRVNVKSKTGATIDGVYVDTFIAPDKLGTQHIRTNIKKVEAAISHTKKMGAGIVTMGGFTSIVLEGNLGSHATDKTKYTTGNTLTTAFIVKGVELAAVQHNIDLKSASVLIIGATGDIGQACVLYMKDKCRKLLLCARNLRRLKTFADHLTENKVNNAYSIDLGELLPQADVIICVASSSGLKFSNCKEHVIICDAGYPKNLDKKIEDNYDLIFHGGMGQVECGYTFTPDYSDSFYQYPAPFVIHGCILEAMILAFENKFENYTSGKGNITVEKIEEIYNWGVKHGIILAPFYNNKGLC